MEDSKKRRGFAPPLRSIDRRSASSCGSRGRVPRRSKGHRCRRISRRFCDALSTFPARHRGGAACRNARIVVDRHVCSTRGRISRRVTNIGFSEPGQRRFRSSSLVYLSGLHGPCRVCYLGNVTKFPAPSTAKTIAEGAGGVKREGARPVNPLARERRSRDTRPQPAWRPPATPCNAAQA